MSNMLSRMRSRVKERENKFTPDAAIFPYWELPVNGMATIRLLPWMDEVSGGFWTEKKQLNMTFVDPDHPERQVRFRAPCLEMYDNAVKCPIANVVRGVYSEVKALEEEGKKKVAEDLGKIASDHWVKITGYYQGILIDSGFTEKNGTPENPIRIFPFVKTLHKSIKDAVMDEKGGFEKLPTGEFTMDDIRALEAGELPEGETEEEFIAKFLGLNYRIKKTMKKEHANYTDGSSWSPQGWTTLEDDHIAALAQYGMHDLREKLPKRPTDEQFEVMAEMMQVSLAYARGEDEGVWNKEWEDDYIKPFRPKSSGGDGDGESSSTTSSSGISSRLRRTEKTNSNDGDGAKASVSASVRDKLSSKTRGVQKPVEEAEEAVEDPDGAVEETQDDQIEDQVDNAPEEEPETVDEPVEEVEKTPVKSEKSAASSSLADRIKSRVESKKKGG